jgi:fluoroacetyl-CoA thioesterase
MPDIPMGTHHSSEILVTDNNAISFLGRDDARVLATPWLIAHLEMTARDAVKPYLLDSEDTLGTQVNVRHLAATPMGMRAQFFAEVIGIKGRRVEFRVEARDDKDKIAEGTHERFIVDVDQFADRLKAKRPTGTS